MPAGFTMTPGWTVLIALHAAGATVAVILGAYLVLRRRRGDLLHRRLGRFWMADMYWVAFSSFGIKRLTPGHFSWIHALSAWTVISLTMAIWAARTHRVQAHRGWVVGTYLGLLGAGLAAMAFPVIRLERFERRAARVNVRCSETQHRVAGAKAEHACLRRCRCQRFQPA